MGGCKSPLCEKTSLTAVIASIAQSSPHHAQFNVAPAGQCD